MKIPGEWTVDWSPNCHFAGFITEQQESNGDCYIASSINVEVHDQQMENIATAQDNNGNLWGKAYLTH